MSADAPPDHPSLPRFEALSALAGVLPYHRRDQLSELLTDADAATLRHLAEQGMGANTLRAVALPRPRIGLTVSMTGSRFVPCRRPLRLSLDFWVDSPNLQHR